MHFTPGDQDRNARNPRGRGLGLVRSPEFEVRVNGQPPSDWFNVRAHEHSKAFTITPGEPLAIFVRIAVPAPGRVAGLWLGIWHGSLSASKTGPIGMNPVLHRTSAPLAAGEHAFDFGWTVPDDLQFEPNLWFGFAVNGLLPGRTGGGPERLIEATIAGPITYLFRSPDVEATSP